jgi:hypothetical protein
MDTVIKHRKKLLRTYKSSKSSVDVINSAKELAVAVLHNPKLIPKHKRKILSEVQWLISEVDGKYSTRYRSKLVVDLAASPSDSAEKIQHEHVVARKEITAQLLADPDNAARILDQVVACVVAKSEHDRLAGSGSGWNRYKEAGIVVYDMSTTPPSHLDFTKRT